MKARPVWPKATTEEGAHDERNPDHDQREPGADEDALRRDGLASVLRENAEIEVLAGCSDGQTALDEIRDLRPDIAIVDLNLPVLHGIDLVRRIRGESLGTKIILVSGTRKTRSSAKRYERERMLIC